MGDGRYYTYFQFVDIMVLTLLSVLSVISILFFHYRKNKDMNIIYITVPTDMIYVFLVIRIIESIIPNLIVASTLRELQLILLLTSIVLCILNKNYINKKIKPILLVSLVFALTIPFLNIVIKTYKFHTILYSDYYKMFLFFAMNCLSGYLFFKKNSEITKYKLIVIIIPMLIYLIIVIINSYWVCYMELFISLFVIIYTNLVFTLNSESSHSILAFEKIGNISTNYIFVIDNNKKVIYSNDMAKMSEFFSDIKYIENITSIFKGDKIKNNTHLDKNYINIKKDDEEFYFTYGFSELFHNEKIIGHIVTITNITDLILLLNDLENKKSQSIMINEKLSNYSKVVYHHEKEKEINNLLEEVVESRDAQMKHLINLIEDTKNKIDSDDFENYIEISIEKSNEILDDVRKTVSKYREYYGG